MAKCPRCGKTYPDDVVACSDCLETLESESAEGAPVVPYAPPELLVKAMVSLPQNPRLSSRFVKFCLSVAIAVSFINCIAVPVLALWFFFGYIARNYHTVGDIVVLIVLAALMFPLAFFMAVAQCAVFGKVHSLIDVEIAPQEVKHD